VKRLFAAVVFWTSPLAFAGFGEPVSFQGPGVELAGRILVPQGAGPFPAIVLLHGCSGLWNRKGTDPTQQYQAWAEHFRDQGYVALLVDSFGPRGSKEICTQKDRTIHPETDRPRDAYAALRWLATRKDVDVRRIDLIARTIGPRSPLRGSRSGNQRGSAHGHRRVSGRPSRF